MTRYFSVYAHFHRGELIYIGCGWMKRPYVRTSRNKLWRERVKDDAIDVQIISRHRSQEVALGVEGRLIMELCPPCNVAGTKWSDPISTDARRDLFPLLTSKQTLRRMAKNKGIGFYKFAEVVRANTETHQ